MAQTVEELWRDVAFDFQSQLFVGQLTAPSVSVVDGLYRGSIVEVDVEGIVFLLNVGDALGQTGLVAVGATHADIISLGGSTHRKDERSR